MNKVIAALLVLILAALVVLIVRLGEEPAQAQSKKGGKPWTEQGIGDIPTSFGDLVTAVGTPPNWGLVFKNQQNEIFLVEFRGNALSNRCKKITREY